MRAAAVGEVAGARSETSGAAAQRSKTIEWRGVEERVAWSAVVGVVVRGVMRDASDVTGVEVESAGGSGGLGLPVGVDVELEGGGRATGDGRQTGAGM